MQVTTCALLGGRTAMTRALEPAASAQRRARGTHLLHVASRHTALNIECACQPPTSLRPRYGNTCHEHDKRHQRHLCSHRNDPDPDTAQPNGDPDEAAVRPKTVLGLSARHLVLELVLAVVVLTLGHVPCAIVCACRAVRPTETLERNSIM